MKFNKFNTVILAGFIAIVGVIVMQLFLLNQAYIFEKKDIEDKIIQISINRHDSKHIFIAGHYDCAGCPVSDDQQKDYIRRATHLIKKDIPTVRVTGIFIDDDFNSNILEDLI